MQQELSKSLVTREVRRCTTLLMRTPWEGAPSLEQLVLLQPEAGSHYMIVYSVPRWRTATRHGQRYLLEPGGQNSVFGPCPYE